MSDYNQTLTPILYDLRGQLTINNFGLFSRHVLEEMMLNIATIITSHIAYKENDWRIATAHIACHLSKQLVDKYKISGASQSAVYFDFAELVSGYTIKSLVPIDTPIARGNVEGSWTDTSQDTDCNDLMEGVDFFFPTINYDFRYNLSTAVHEDRHIYESHQYQAEDIFVSPMIKNSINSIVTSARNSTTFDVRDAWIVLKSETY